MTITLAAVYVPIGIQGGLTGTLFREFAFTLAGAVTISGVVALTLSPDDVGATACAPAPRSTALPARSTAPSTASARRYGRMLDRTLQVRPAVYVAWIGLSLLGFSSSSFPSR